ncbi:MAG: hypothetical protein ACK4TP_17430 [Hyphomicrobium sp.]
MRWEKAGILLLVIHAVVWLSRTSSDESQLRTDTLIVQRFTDAQKHAFATNRATPPDIEFEHPLVAAMRVENRRFTAAPMDAGAQMRGWITIELTLLAPLEEGQMDAIAAAVRGAAGAYDSVGVRFILPAEQGIDRDPEGIPSHYSWRLFDGDRVDVNFTAGVTPASVSRQLSKMQLAKGERIYGVWVDHNFVNGAIAIVLAADGSPSATFLIDPGTRYHLPSMPAPQRGRVDASAKVGEFGTFKNDGIEADRLGVRLLDDGRLLVYSGSGVTKDLPWLVATPWAPPG